MGMTIIVIILLMGLFFPKLEPSKSWIGLPFFQLELSVGTFKVQNGTADNVDWDSSSEDLVLKGSRPQRISSPEDLVPQTISSQEDLVHLGIN